MAPWLIWFFATVMSPAVTAMNSSAGMTITAATIAVMPPAPMPVFLGGGLHRAVLLVWRHRVRLVRGMGLTICLARGERG